LFKQDIIPAKRLIEKEKLIKGIAILFYNNNTDATAAMAAPIIAAETTTIAF